jgi:hypothetical protein
MLWCGAITGLGRFEYPSLRPHLELPFPAPTEFDPCDFARMEGLRGSKGTLYGASIMGGLVKFVTNNPSKLHRNADSRIGCKP